MQSARIAVIKIISSCTLKITVKKQHRRIDREVNASLVIYLANKTQVNLVSKEKCRGYGPCKHANQTSKYIIKHIRVYHLKLSQTLAVRLLTSLGFCAYAINMRRPVPRFWHSRSTLRSFHMLGSASPVPGRTGSS